MALNFTLLTEEQIWGGKDGNGQLDVMKKFGTKVAPTDLAVLLGGYTDYSPTMDGKYTCCAWTTSSRRWVDVYCVGYNGGRGHMSPDTHSVPVRPALSPSETEKLVLNGHKTVKNGVEILKYGEYPQTIANNDISAQLERLYQSQSLHPRGKIYTFDSFDPNYYDPRFRKTTYSEYELDGKKYIRVIGRSSDSHLSNGEKVKGGRAYWVEVQPIEWLVDKSGTWVSKKCLFAGIQFDTGKYYDGDFSKTFMKKYLDTYFAKEMGHEEIVAQKEKQKRDKVLMGLSARLEEATSDEAVEAIKKRLMEAEKNRAVKTAPNRLHEAARIKRLRNARDILNEAAQQAYDAGDRALLDGIIDLSSTYAARDQGQQNRVAQRRAVRRAQRKQGGRG